MGAGGDDDCKGGGFTVQTPGSWRGSTAARVARLEDRGRDIESRMGFRPYAVHLVTVSWAGGRRGDGPEEVVQDVAILPPPDVEGLDALARSVEGATVVEQGRIRVSGISAFAYTEDQLACRPQDGSPSSRATRTFYEVALLANGCEVAGQRRRFQPVGVPTLDANRSSWQVTLERAYPDRNRDGSLGQPPR